MHQNGVGILYILMETLALPYPIARAQLKLHGWDPRQGRLGVVKDKRDGDCLQSLIEEATLLFRVTKELREWLRCSIMNDAPLFHGRGRAD